MHSTLLYGTRVESDRPLFATNTDLAPHYYLSLFECQCDEQFNDLDIKTPFYSSHGRELMYYSNRDFGQGISGQPWRFEVQNVVNFYWVSGEKTIYYTLEKEGNNELLNFWFTHIFLPVYFTLENKYDFLHAGAVEIAGKPVLFIAPSTGGKSTMTDYFIRQGHGLVSDDKVATYIKDGQFIAVPSHPHHRPYRRFEDLGYRVDNMFSHTLPIHAFYELEVNDEGADITITEIQGFKKFEILLPNYLFSFSYLKAQRLKYLTDMVNNIPLYQVKRPWDMDRLGDVHDAIIQHSTQLSKDGKI